MVDRVEARLDVTFQHPLIGVGAEQVDLGDGVLGAHRAHQRASDRQQRGERRQADRASRTDRTGRSHAQGQEREVTAGAR
jgi:hypothetical protein